VYKGKVILYDTGDFVDDYAVYPDLRNDRSFLFEAEVEEKKIIGMKLIPVHIENKQVNFAEGADAQWSLAQWSLARMQHLSKAFGTTIKNTGEVEGLSL
jgi:poly-gamma-glutamate synthesis protein (capsule biosynthesis protein)